jgi:hypothetical protein
MSFHHPYAPLLAAFGKRNLHEPGKDPLDRDGQGCRLSG